METILYAFTFNLMLWFLLAFVLTPVFILMLAMNLINHVDAWEKSDEI